jgi:hypothetical protein
LYQGTTSGGPKKPHGKDRWASGLMPWKATKRKACFSDFGDSKGNQIPVSGGVEGDQNFDFY